MFLLIYGSIWICWLLKNPVWIFLSHRGIQLLLFVGCSLDVPHYCGIQFSFVFFFGDLVWITLLIVGFSLDILTNHWILFVCFKSLLDRVSQHFVGFSLDNHSLLTGFSLDNHSLHFGFSLGNHSLLIVRFSLDNHSLLTGGIGGFSLNVPIYCWIQFGLSKCWMVEGTIYFLLATIFKMAYIHCTINSIIHN